MSDTHLLIDTNYILIGPTIGKSWLLRNGLPLESSIAYIETDDILTEVWPGYWESKDPERHARLADKMVPAIDRRLRDGYTILGAYWTPALIQLSSIKLLQSADRLLPISLYRMFDSEISSLWGVCKQHITPAVLHRWRKGFHALPTRYSMYVQKGFFLADIMGRDFSNGTCRHTFDLSKLIPASQELDLFTNQVNAD